MDKEIQVSNNLEDNLCEDEPNEEYWKELAKEREKALNDTLEENRSLCELIQGNDWSIFYRTDWPMIGVQQPPRSILI